MSCNPKKNQVQNAISGKTVTWPFQIRDGGSGNFWVGRSLEDWIISPNFGVKIRNIWNHHPAITIFQNSGHDELPSLTNALQGNSSNLQLHPGKTNLLEPPPKVPSNRTVNASDSKQNNRKRWKSQGSNQPGNQPTTLFCVFFPGWFCKRKHLPPPNLFGDWVHLKRPRLFFWPDLISSRWIWSQK